MVQSAVKTIATLPPDVFGYLYGRPLCSISFLSSVHQRTAVSLAGSTKYSKRCLYVPIHVSIQEAAQYLDVAEDRFEWGILPELLQSNFELKFPEILC